MNINEIKESLAVVVKTHGEWRELNDWFYSPSPANCLRYARSEASEFADLVMRRENSHHIRRRKDNIDLELRMIEELSDTAAMLVALLIKIDRLEYVFQAIDTLVDEGSFSSVLLDRYLDTIKYPFVASDALLFKLSLAVIGANGGDEDVFYLESIAHSVIIVYILLDAMIGDDNQNPIVHALGLFEKKIESRRPA